MFKTDSISGAGAPQSGGHRRLHFFLHVTASAILLLIAIMNIYFCAAGTVLSQLKTVSIPGRTIVATYWTSEQKAILAAAVAFSVLALLTSLPLPLRRANWSALAVCYTGAGALFSTVLFGLEIGLIALGTRTVNVSSDVSAATVSTALPAGLCVLIAGTVFTGIAGGILWLATFRKYQKHSAREDDALPRSMQV